MSKSKLILPVSIVFVCLIFAGTFLYVYQDKKNENISKHVFEMNIKCEEYIVEKYDGLSERSNDYFLSRSGFYSYELNSCILREDVSAGKSLTKMLMNLNTKEIITQYNSECAQDTECSNLGEFFNVENNLRKY